MKLGAIAIAAAVFGFASPLAYAEEGGTVAIAAFEGPKSSGARTAVRTLEEEFQAGGFQLAGEGDEGVHLVVRGSVKKVKKQFELTVVLVSAADDKVIARAKGTYKRGRGAKNAVRAIARELVPAAQEAIGPLLAKGKKKSRPKTAVAAVVPVDEQEEADPAANAPEDPPRAAAKNRGAPSDAVDEAPAANASERVATPSKQEDHKPPLFVFRVSGGSQAQTAYTVAVADQVTALAYRLTPLLLVAGNIRFQVPRTGLGIEAELSYSPVKYSLDTQPAVDPAEPSGQFLNVGGSLGYAFTLARFGEGSRFVLEPQAGLRFESLGVQEQMPFSIVLGHAAIAIPFGARTKLLLGDSVDLELAVLGRWIASYKEKPTATGEGGKGLGVYVGGAVRYWFTSMFGISMDGGYEYSKIGFTGEGARATFVSDPALIDASLFSSNFKIGLGVLLAI